MKSKNKKIKAMFSLKSKSKEYYLTQLIDFCSSIVDKCNEEDIYFFATIQRAITILGKRQVDLDVQPGCAIINETKESEPK